MKPQEIPKLYTEYFCMKKDIIVCDYLLNKACPRTCNHAKRFHPVERGKTLGFKTQEEYDETFLRK